MLTAAVGPFRSSAITGSSVAFSWFPGRVCCSSPTRSANTYPLARAREQSRPHQIRVAAAAISIHTLHSDPRSELPIQSLYVPHAFAGRKHKRSDTIRVSFSPPPPLMNGRTGSPLCVGLPLLTPRLVPSRTSVHSLSLLLFRKISGDKEFLSCDYS